MTTVGACLIGVLIICVVGQFVCGRRGAGFDGVVGGAGGAQEVGGLPQTRGIELRQFKAPHPPSLALIFIH